MKLPMEDGEQYAVLVVDMQRDGLDPDGAIFVAGGYEITDSILALTRTARTASWPVIHTQHVHRPDLSDFGISKYFEPPSCIEGTPGMDFVPKMAPQPGDLVVQKRRYDAFQGTELDAVLRQLDVRGLFVCGVVTDGCVLSTVVHARNLDYKVWMVADALSGTNPAMHDAALTIVDTYFGDVVSTRWACDAINSRLDRA